MSRWLAGVLFGIAGGLIALLAERMLYPPPATIQVDVAALVSEHMRRPELMKLSESERSVDAARFAARLEQETARLAHEYEAVILASPAVITGAPDLTAVLRKRLEDKAP
ncbi:MAG: TrbI F-type domain-containing protein [Gammaproteobacteria bacterium]|nr:TrbI F-type domain-containing protein [Gammaproteobacteria bacterium]